MEQVEQEIVPEITEEVEKSVIKGIIDTLLTEDKFAHDLIIRINKKLELYYKGYQRTFWSYIHNDWDSPDFPSFDPLYITVIKTIFQIQLLKSLTFSVVTESQ